jgi:Circularly permutated YpsA SLOG family
MAEKHNKPWIHIDLNRVNPFKDAEHEIKVLNVGGPRASKDQLIYSFLTSSY